MSMNITVETITPARAEELLKLNSRNRVMRNQQVEFHASNLRNKRWKLLHQGIAISSDNVLLDGQHRLQAIVVTGIAAEMVVATGVDPQSLNAIDTGARRNPGDVFHMQQIPNAPLAASTTRILRSYWLDSWGGEVVPHGELLDLYYECKGLEEAMKVARGQYKDVGMRLSCLAAAVYLTRHSAVASHTVNEWLEQFVDGVGVKADSSAYVLRRQLRNHANNEKRTSSRGHMGLYAKAWAIHAIGRPVPKFLQFRDHDPMLNIQNPREYISNTRRRR